VGRKERGGSEIEREALSEKAGRFERSDGSSPLPGRRSEAEEGEQSQGK
jgi:hypothetical protein